MNNIEKRLLSKTRFFDGTDHEIEELLDKRYSNNPGSQKNYLWLKPTEIDDDCTQDDDADIEEVDDNDKNNERLNQIGKFDIKTFPWNEVTKSPAASTTKNPKKDEKIQLKRQRKTTRLSFKLYVKDQLAKRHSQIKNIKRLKKGRCYIKNITKLQLFSNYYMKTHKFWLGYIRELINGVNDMQQILTRLSSAEFVGAMIRITSSHDEKLNNLIGVVVYEFKNSWLICVPNGLKYGKGVSLHQQEKYLSKYLEIIDAFNGAVDGLPSLQLKEFTASEIVGGLKMIQKKDNLFKFMIPCSNNSDANNNSTTENNDCKLKKVCTAGGEDFLEFSIIGSRFLFKSVDRSNKKFKSHGADDLKFWYNEKK